MIQTESKHFISPTDWLGIHHVPPCSQSFIGENSLSSSFFAVAIGGGPWSEFHGRLEAQNPCHVLSITEKVWNFPGFFGEICHFPMWEYLTFGIQFLERSHVFGICSLLHLHWQPRYLSTIGTSHIIHHKSIIEHWEIFGISDYYDALRFCVCPMMQIQDFPSVVEFLDAKHHRGFQKRGIPQAMNINEPFPWKHTIECWFASFK